MLPSLLLLQILHSFLFSAAVLGAALICCSSFCTAVADAMPAYCCLVQWRSVAVAAKAVVFVPLMLLVAQSIAMV